MALVDGPCVIGGQKQRQQSAALHVRGALVGPAVGRIQGISSVWLTASLGHSSLARSEADHRRALCRQDQGPTEESEASVTGPPASPSSLLAAPAVRQAVLDLPAVGHRFHIRAFLEGKRYFWALHCLFVCLDKQPLR